jgi:soluble epoxide hydrolase / lipid-phosphate phosphatase
VNVAYLVPGDKFSIDHVLEVTKKIFGYGTHWYWKLFTADDGAQILDSHLEALWTVLHGEPETWLDILCSPDGLRNFLLADKRQPVQAYATEDMKRVWIDQFERGGFDGPLNYYRSTAFGVQDEVSKAIPKENIKVKVPFLFFGGKRDMVCRPELLQSSIDAGLLPDVTSLIVDTGHWSYLSHPKEFGEALVGWLKSKF